MRFTLAFAAAAAHSALAIPAKPSGRGFGCGAPEPDAEHIKISQKFAQQEAAFAASGNFSIQAVTTVDTYFHVVASSTSLSGGYLTVSQPHFPLHLRQLLQRLTRFPGRHAHSPT
jgi:hypothetical protein